MKPRLRLGSVQDEPLPEEHRGTGDGVMGAPEHILKRLRHVARIMGPSSASAKALNEYDQRIAAGEDVTIFEDHRSIVVGPTPPSHNESRTTGGVNG
jgi:hypothetical protein